MSELILRNRQRSRRINTRSLRRILETVLVEALCVTEYEVGVHLVSAREMTRVNETFLGHEGSTDVITFDHSEDKPSKHRIHGELFVCVDDAVAQAGQFRATWQSEVVRYCLHGILHLLGHDDHRAADRRKMKQVENRLVRLAARRFALSRL